MEYTRWVAGVVMLVCGWAHGQGVKVEDARSLREAMARATPGTRVVLAAGHYGSVTLEDVKGSADAPIVIEGPADGGAVFGDASQGLHLRGCAHVTLRNLTIRNATGNGINIDDKGDRDTPSHHIVLENIAVVDTGPTGNRDAVKLSGVDDFLLRGCTIEGWGGSGIDMVGCHRGLIERCTFRGKNGFSQSNAVQIKGGSAEVVVRRCRFIDAGQRGVNIGGSTGMQFFRPADAKYEARDIVVEGCTFRGSDAPIAFVGVDGAVVRYNTIDRPKRWIIRILQETTAEGFVPCRNGVFEHNVVVFDGSVRTHVNVGGNTAPETFQFAQNVWYNAANPALSRPNLPTREADGIHGTDPKLNVRPDGTIRQGEPTPSAGAEALAEGGN